MTPLNTYVEISFLDDAGRTTRVTYPSFVRLDTGLANIDDVVENITGNIAGNIANMSNSKLDRVRLIVDFAPIGTVADGSNNQVVAFTRCTFDDGNIAAIEVPSWDTGQYFQDSNNLLDTEYVVLVEYLSQFIAHPDTWLALDDTTQFSQSRARKGRQTVG